MAQGARILELAAALKMDVQRTKLIEEQFADCFNQSAAREIRPDLL